MRMHNPPHPGEILKEALESIPMTITEFAAHIGVARVNLSRIVNCRGGITPEMSIKLSQAFRQGQGDIWFRMQAAHDFWQASQVRCTKVQPVKMKLAKAA
ncbi:MAG: HigA family addiction module antitoxin [Acidobacteriota bacterium]|nr:HigA family addiction module antitoxin [Acidobacteriota bacterium]